MNTTNHTIIYDWNLRDGKNKTVWIVMLVAMLGLMVFPLMMSRQTDLIVRDIGLGAYTLMWVALVIGIMVIHEGLHGLFFWIYSRHVSFGIKWKTRFGPTPYATSDGRMFTKKQYQMIGFAPQFLTAICLVVGIILGAPVYVILVMAAAANLGGGCVDMWSIYEVQRLPKDILVEDTSDGFRVWRPIQ